MTATSGGDTPPAGSPPARRGGLIVPVPEAEATVAPWMGQYLPIWKLGVPAHVTLLFPFPTVDHLDAATLAEVTALFASVPSIGVTFSEVGRFPDVVYLAPEPKAWFIGMTERLSARFGLQPYGGQHAEIVPHLTVARHADPAVQATIAAELAQILPIVTTVHEVLLVEEEPDGHWRHAARFPLGPPVS
jgi:2'-5' RNA ligase